MKTVVTITGIRPDFIRMSTMFKTLDENFNHILIYTGQHYDKMLSEVFFKELNIRKPDYNLQIGGNNAEHFEQQSVLTTAIIDLLRGEKLEPDIILFLGDSNSVLAAVPLKKEGYRIGHIEAGMRSYDRKMLEEINRVVCDHCSDILFVYHEDYKQQALLEGISEKNVHVVGNTIVEVCKPIVECLVQQPKKYNQILLDIHRPENFKYKDRLTNILDYANYCSKRYKLPVKMLSFKRTQEHITKFNISIGDIEVVDLMSYKKYLEEVYNSLFIISDSGTAQEEPALLDTSVIVPRDFTERSQSVENDCSYMLDVNKPIEEQNASFSWIENTERSIKTTWLGNGKTSDFITNILLEIL